MCFVKLEENNDDKSVKEAFIGPFGLRYVSIIISNKIPIVYYTKTRYSRVLSPCEQEYYYEVQWYKDAGRTELIGTSKGGTEVVNLC